MNKSRKHLMVTGIFCILGMVIIDVSFAQSKKYGPTAIHEAAHTGNINVVREILLTKPDPDIRDSFGGTALHAAMFQKNIDIVKLLIDAGYDVNAIGPSNGYTPLHDAVWADNAAAAQLLIQRGARKNIKGKDGLTPLEKAIKENKTEMIKVLSE